MPRGGARTRPGPPPDPNALRRERESGWIVLPAEGRRGEPPAWPLLGLTDREAELWRSLWGRPQAVQWEALRQEFEVALYVRNLALAEIPGSPVALGTLVRQQADALGLTIPGLRTNRWRIAVAEQGATDRQPQRRARASGRPGARERFRVVDGTDGR